MNINQIVKGNMSQIIKRNLFCIFLLDIDRTEDVNNIFEKWYIYKFSEKCFEFWSNINTSSDVEDFLGYHDSDNIYANVLDIFLNEIFRCTQFDCEKTQNPFEHFENYELKIPDNKWQQHLNITLFSFIIYVYGSKMLDDHHLYMCNMSCLHKCTVLIKEVYNILYNMKLLEILGEFNKIYKQSFKQKIKNEFEQKRKMFSIKNKK
jgi:hypothetical protein